MFRRHVEIEPSDPTRQLWRSFHRQYDQYLLRKCYTLRQLTKMRLVIRGLTIPSLSVPVIEVAMCSGLLPLWQSKVAVASASLCYAIFDALDWFLSYDINELSLVNDSKWALPRTLQYFWEGAQMFASFIHPSSFFPADWLVA